MTSCAYYLPLTYPLDILFYDLVYLLLAIDLHTLYILLCDLVYLLPV